MCAQYLALHETAGKGRHSGEHNGSVVESVPHLWSLRFGLPHSRTADQSKAEKRRLSNQRYRYSSRPSHPLNHLDVPRR